MTFFTNLRQLISANWRMTWHDALIYRFHTVFFIVFESIFFIANFYTLHVGFELAGGSVNGWSKEQAFLVSSIFNFTHQIFLTFLSSFIFEIGEKCGSGAFDFILLKPHHPLVSLWASCTWIVQNIPSTVLSGAVFIYLLVTSAPADISLLNYLSGFAFVILGVLVRLGLALLCVCPVFFSERLLAVDTYWNLASVGVYPQQILPRILQYLFTFGLPVMLISSVPAEAFFGMRSPLYLVACFGVGLVFFMFTLKIFAWAIRHYKSVNAGI